MEVNNTNIRRGTSIKSFFVALQELLENPKNWNNVVTTIRMELRSYSCQIILKYFGLSSEKVIDIISNIPNPSALYQTASLYLPYLKDENFIAHILTTCSNEYIYVIMLQKLFANKKLPKYFSLTGNGKNILYFMVNDSNTQHIYHFKYCRQKEGLPQTQVVKYKSKYIDKIRIRNYFGNISNPDSFYYLHLCALLARKPIKILVANSSNVKKYSMENRAEPPISLKEEEISNFLKNQDDFCAQIDLSQNPREKIAEVFEAKEKACASNVIDLDQVISLNISFEIANGADFPLFEEILYDENILKKRSNYLLTYHISVLGTCLIEMKLNEDILSCKLSQISGSAGKNSLTDLFYYMLSVLNNIPEKKKIIICAPLDENFEVRPEIQLIKSIPSEIAFKSFDSGNSSLLSYFKCANHIFTFGLFRFNFFDVKLPFCEHFLTFLNERKVNSVQFYLTQDNLKLGIFNVITYFNAFSSLISIINKTQVGYIHLHILLKGNTIDSTYMQILFELLSNLCIIQFDFMKHLCVSLYVIPSAISYDDSMILIDKSICNKKIKISTCDLSENTIQAAMQYFESDLYYNFLFTQQLADDYGYKMEGSNKTFEKTKKTTELIYLLIFSKNPITKLKKLKKWPIVQCLSHFIEVGNYFMIRYFNFPC